MFPGLKWGDVLKITSKMINDYLPDIKTNRENLGKNLSKIVSKDIIAKTLEDSPLYYVKNKVEIELSDPLKEWDEKFHKYLKADKEAPSDDLRAKYTQKIKERVVPRGWNC